LRPATAAASGLDLKQRLASFRATHLGTSEEWHLKFDRDPEVWFGPVTMLMLAALQPAMDRIAALRLHGSNRSAAE